jgi:hypothetical protein
MYRDGEGYEDIFCMMVVLYLTLSCVLALVHYEDT